MKRRVDRGHFIRILQHTESHNRAKEEQSMWLQKKNEHKIKRGYSEELVEVEIEQKRFESKKPKLDCLINGKENSFIEKPKSMEPEENKWGHGGYWELYPDQNRKESKEYSSTDSEKSIKKVKNLKRLKKVKKAKVSRSKNKTNKKDKKLKKRKKKQKISEVETAQISSESDYHTN